MKSSAHDLRAASGLLTQLLPHNVVRDARELALKFERDEAFREYVLARFWAIVPVVLAFVLVSTLCAIGVMFATSHMTSPPVPAWMRLLGLLLGALVWVGGVTAQAAVFLLWLEERSAQRARELRGIPAAVPPGVLAYLKYSRALAPWMLVAVFVVAPLAILAVNAPLIALAVAALGVLAPVLYKRFDS